MTEFQVALHREFGEMVGDSLLSDTILSDLDGKTPQEALDAGYDIEKYGLHSVDISKFRRKGDGGRILVQATWWTNSAENPA